MIFNKGVYTYKNIYDLLPSLKQFQNTSSLRYVIVIFKPEFNYIGFEFSNTCRSFMNENGIICAYRKSGDILFICDTDVDLKRTFYYNEKDVETNFLVENYLKTFSGIEIKFIKLDIKYVDFQESR